MELPEDSYGVLRRQAGLDDALLAVTLNAETIADPSGFETRAPQPPWSASGQTYVIRATIGSVGNGAHPTWGALGVEPGQYVLGLQGSADARYPLSWLTVGRRYCLTCFVAGRVRTTAVLIM